MADLDKVQGVAIRGLPGKIGPNSRGPVRTDQYGNVVTYSIGEACL